MIQRVRAVIFASITLAWEGSIGIARTELTLVVVAVQMRVLRVEFDY